MGNKPPYYLTAYDLAVKWGFRGSEEDWLNSLTAYAMAKAAGYTGTADQWLKDLMNPVPNIQIGGVTTLPGGSEATAEFRGNPRNPMLYLGIPRGMGMADAMPLVGGKMKGNINMDGHSISGLGEPADGTDAANRNYVDKRLKKDGTEPMEGNLDLGNHRIIGLEDPEAGTDAANRNYVDKRLKRDGTEALEGNLDLGNHRILHVASPLEETDATNKKFVEDLVDGKHLSACVLVPASEWSDTAPYTQTISVAGVLASDAPHYGVVYTAGLESAMAEKDAFAMVDDLDAGEGSVTLTCFAEKPGIDLTIQMEVNR